MTVMTPRKESCPEGSFSFESAFCGAGATNGAPTIAHLRLLQEPLISPQCHTSG